MLAADPAARPPMSDVAHTLAALHSDTAAITAVATLPLSSPPPQKPPPLQPEERASVKSAPAEPAAVAPIPAAVPVPTADRAAGPTERMQPAGPLVAGTTALPLGGGPVDRPPQNRPSASDREPQRRRSAGPLALFAVAALLIGAIILGLVLLGNRDNGSSAKPPATNSSAGSTSPAGSTTASSPPRSTSPASSSAVASTTAPASTTASAPATSASVRPSSSAPTNSAPAGGTPTASELAGAVRNYYSLLPGNTDAAWSRLTAQFQNGRAGGRQSFDNYWASMRQVSVSNVTANPPGTVVATVNYVYKNGKTVSERTTFGLVSENGTLKINSQG
jgi:hypothetical protein